MLRDGIVLLNEFVYRHEAAANAQDQIVILHLHDDLVGEVAVATLGLSHEQTLYALLRVTLVNKVCQFSIDRVILLRYVLEVHLMQFAPIFQHLVKLSVAVPEGFHLGLVRG